MLNGNDLESRSGASQRYLIIQKPSSLNLYYVFATSCANEIYSPGLWYSVVDMDLDGGLGGVTEEKNIPLEIAWDARDKLTGFRKNNDTILVVAYKAEDDEYAIYTLTVNGVGQQPVISPSLPRENPGWAAPMKVSYDKKYLVSAFRDINGYSTESGFEICKLNLSNRELELLYTIRLKKEGDSHFSNPNCVEFSPDSKLLYLCTHRNTQEGEDRMALYQFDMQYIEDSSQFIESGILIAEGEMGGLQLATDGKIYMGGGAFDNFDYISVIHEPWRRGVECNFEEDAIYFGVNKTTEYLPNIMLDFLYRFEWQGRCSAEPFIFQPNFQPDPVAIQWNFDDPGAGADSISTELTPVHYFTHAGEFEVNVVVQYPNGRIERTSRVVTVDQSPQPNLGPDTLMCAQGEITLNAGEEEGLYLWSNGSFGQNANELMVSDTGWYWVEVTNEVDCMVRDSIHVGLYPEAEVNEDNLNIVPTACGGSSGKILGLQVTGSEPLSYAWYDSDSNFLSNELDFENLPVGNYYLHILDGNGCTTITQAYTIFDSGDIEVTAVEKEDAHCNQATGSITISINIGNTGDLLYSIDNGNTWQNGIPVFTSLSPGNYVVRVKDQTGCEGVYENNPVIIENIAGPDVTNVSTIPEIDYLQNGQINITATIGEGQIHYSINNGINFQADNGLFTNLSAGTFACMVKDDFGCDTTFIVEVTRTISQLIEAIAGDDNTCLGDAAVVPLVLYNFINVSKFHVLLNYDTAVLQCDGYMNIHPDLQDSLKVSIIPISGEIVLSWQGKNPLTLPENAQIAELVLGAKREGFTQVDWIASSGESNFYNESGDEISVDYQLGKVRIFSRPQIDMYSKVSPCEGDDFTKYPWVSGGAGEYIYEWTGPNNYFSNTPALEIPNISKSQAGLYTLTVIDTVNCVESKSLEIIVDENPLVAFADYDTIFGEPGFVLDAGGDYNYYFWNTGERTSEIIINTEGLITVEIGTTEMCFAKDSVTVLWGGEPFWLPNAFSPNGDGLNDEFKPVERYDYVQSYRLSIYNRWGEMIFETNNISQGWDGTFKGRPAPGGTYIYKIVYKAYSTGEETQTRKGQVTLVR